MANRRSFKTDISFLEKISIGAIGTRRVFDDLIRQGHQPLELERGSMSYKIWKAIKIKRIRVPDLLCVDCGRRTESRAKTKLEITMSHSFSDPERAWDHGLEDNDLVALVVCHKSGSQPIDWIADELVQYIVVGDLRTAQKANLAKSERPKGAQEGFEARITWPSCSATASGVITDIGDDRLSYRKSQSNRKQTLKLLRSGIRFSPIVRVGDTVTENQIIASVIPIYLNIPCSHGMTEETYITNLTSSSMSDRYTAAKALSHFRTESSIRALVSKISDTKDHIYVRLEAAASLAILGDQRGLVFIKDRLSDEILPNRLEAVIVLGEIGNNGAIRLLVDTLKDGRQDSEIRAGAAWALGEIKDKSTISTLLSSFLLVEENIRIEAARALVKLAIEHTPELINEFSTVEPNIRPGLAWALSKAEKFTFDQMQTALVDENARIWVSYMLGTQEPQRFIEEIEGLRKKDPEVYFAVSVLWQIFNSWIFGLEEYG
ncbi:MAG: HEAT repeat domain-containing protein [Anaerolineae bacterium]|nr:HEAT repeat domain-containing protein [Anaerolineae bacterium]